MKFSVISFKHFNYFFLALFTICLVFSSCEREGDDDDEYEAYEEDYDHSEQRNEITLTVCSETQIILEADRITRKNLEASQVPIIIREFISKETPSSIIEKVELFTQAADLKYYEVTLKGDHRLIFDETLEFICHY